jgi:transposase InsO family protein
MCEVMVVSRSGYYKWLDRKESKQEKKRKKLTIRIHHLFLESRRLYGSPKITALLQREGVRVSQKTVARIMKENELRSRTVKKYKATTNSKHNLPVYENRLNRQFQVEKPNQAWAADITYVPTKEGWLYVASVMDLFSRKIIGWHADDHMNTGLIQTALERAYQNAKPTESVLHHSDRGSQYCSREYQKQLKSFQMDVSMSRKGDCYDNAVIESFHGIFKRELVYLTTFATRYQAKSAIFEYIECFYNRKRIHSTLGYLSPFEFERKYDSLPLTA